MSDDISNRAPSNNGPGRCATHVEEDLGLDVEELGEGAEALPEGVQGAEGGARRGQLPGQHLQRGPERLFRWVGVGVGVIRPLSGCRSGLTRKGRSESAREPPTAPTWREETWKE